MSYPVIFPEELIVGLIIASPPDVTVGLSETSSLAGELLDALKVGDNLVGSDEE